MNPHLLRVDQLAKFREIFDLFKDAKTNRLPVRHLLRLRAELGFVETEETLSTRVASLVSAQAADHGLLFHDFLAFVAVVNAPGDEAGGGGGGGSGIGRGVPHDRGDSSASSSKERLATTPAFLESELEAVFQQLDLNGDGFLDAEEILTAGASAGAPATTWKTVGSGGGGGGGCVAEATKNAGICVSFEDEMGPEDAALVLDDAVAKRRMEEDAEKRRKYRYPDSWQDFEAAGGKGGGRGGRKQGTNADASMPSNFCLDFRGFTDMMRE